jgi:hypothetical protein
MQRQLQPEILDSLSPDHPDARHNRRDLRIINRAMGNLRWFLRELPPLLRPGERILEIGAGTGDLGRLLLARGLSVDGLDLWPRPETWPASQGWQAADLREFDGYGSYPVVIANLILHQFGESDLAQLGKKLRGARAILACEPARSRRSQLLFAALSPLFGANYVSRHDAHVSIAAGFCGDELPRVLGLVGGEWRIRCGRTGLGAYRMIAVRKD